MDDHITFYQQRLSLQGAIFSRIDHNDAMVAIVYRVTQPAGKQFILKICARPNHFLREVYFLKYFAGTLPVPHIMQVVQPETDVLGAILMECLPGTPLRITDFTDTLAYEIGSLLACIHLNRVAGYGDLIQSPDLSSDPRVYFTREFEESFAECSNHLPKTLLEQCRRYYDEHIDLLASVDGPCMVHRDFRPGNLIGCEGKLEGIIDWSSGRGSFAEEDFCPMEHGGWSTDPASKKSFLAGYACVRPVPDYSAMMPLLRLNKAFGTIGFTVRSGTWNAANALIYQVNRRFLKTFF